MYSYFLFLFFFPFCIRKS
uniref:Uncharacterized protein n=1 Tax=Anguilla anguilla TaxID=7936 RepID=A0A0E9RTV9_ANGAN